MILSLLVFSSCKKTSENLDSSSHIEDESDGVDSAEHGEQREMPQQGFTVSGKKEVSQKGFSNAEKASRFFGNFDEADPIAFVLDFSGSMGGQRERILKKELMKSLNALNSKVSFSVIAFSDTGWFLGNRKGWIKASPQNVTEVTQSINKQYVGGGTEWEAGLNLALSLTPHPEAIYFMTDGETNSDVNHLIDYITKQNQSKFPPARIHTTALVQTGVNQPLLDLATKNGGRFTWVNAQGKATTKK